MAKILVIGDTSDATRHHAVKIDQHAQLVSNENFSTVVQLLTGVFFSALGDLDFNKLKTLALTCDEIQVTKELQNDQVEKLSTVLINHLSYFKPVSNWNKSKIDYQLTADTARKHQGPTLWTFGCSHTAGVGLVDPDQECYGKLLSNQLELPWQNVAEPGSSTLWSLTHLLHADIKPNDVVVWATTSPDRDRVVNNGKITEFLMKDMSRDMIGYFTDEQIAFKHLFNVNCGVKYLRLLGVRFIFFSLLPSIDYNRYQIYNQDLEIQFSLNKEWCPTIDWFLDFGNDQMHPGPKSHQQLAKLAYDHLSLLATN